MSDDWGCSPIFVIIPILARRDQVTSHYEEERTSVSFKLDPQHPAVLSRLYTKECKEGRKKRSTNKEAGKISKIFFRLSKQSELLQPTDTPLDGYTNRCHTYQYTLLSPNTWNKTKSLDRSMRRNDTNPSGCLTSRGYIVIKAYDLKLMTTEECRCHTGA